SHFDDEALDELAASIKALGILEPILVRNRQGGGFEIIAGERRWRAAQRAALREVPVFVRELSHREGFEAALVENLQREDLNPIETARAFQRLLEEFDYTQETLASRVGKDRSTIANSLRILKLPAEITDMIIDGRLTEGHGRALLGAPNEATIKRLADQAVKKGWSVRETERQARSADRAAQDRKGPKEAKEKSANVRDLERRLEKRLGTKVVVNDQKGKGRVEIRYSSYDNLDRILAKIL
ncbi:MAG: ParB/RepB/Spo0J family partition protein, partial [Myxococcales bacterium]|nr:ParB/RepB/Spo0J family partition protein [Myxococcales bacterium]